MLGNVLDIFNQDAFGVISLTKHVNDTSQFPVDLGMIGRKGLFEEEFVTTPTIMLETQENSLVMIPNTPPEAPPNQLLKDRRNVRSFVIPNLSIESTITAAEVAGVRDLGGTQLQTVMGQLNRSVRQMTSRLDATIEYHKAGAIKGTILDASGSTIYNLFTEFGVSQDTVDFLLGTTTTEMLKKCYAVSRYIEAAIGQGGGMFTGVEALCGKTFWERFTTHPLVKDAFAFYQANRKSEDLRRSGFTFGGITFYEYNVTVNSTAFVAASEAHFYPVGVPGLFRTTYAPADFIETVNTPALARYLKTAVDKEYQRYVKALLVSRPFSYCTKPKALIKGTTSD